MHGELDTNVPVGEAHQFVDALRSRDHDVEYLELAGEGHVYRGRDARSRLTIALRDFLLSRL